MIRRILVPIDGTQPSWRALEYACDLAETCKASLVIMTVTTRDIEAPILVSDSDHLYGETGDAVLDSALAILSGKNIDCTFVLESTRDIGEAVLSAAEHESCDNIVLGSRGLGFFQGLLHNSVSQHVIEYTKIPVTIVK